MSGISQALVRHRHNILKAERNTLILQIKIIKMKSFEFVKLKTPLLLLIKKFLIIKN